MKFTVRLADQIVGAFIILALAALVFVIFMAGNSQRWFSRNYYFKTYFSSASGLSDNMPVLYKGFTIGRVKSFDLAEDDRVEVRFFIFDTYISRVRAGSLVEIMISPINLGNQFLFHPGLGPDQIAEGDLIPAVSSPEGKFARASGLTQVPTRDDSISLILSRLSTTLDSANTALITITGLAAQIGDAFTGTGDTSIGRIVQNTEHAVAGIENMTEDLPEIISESLDTVMTEVEPIIANLRDLSAKLNDPDGTLSLLLRSDGEVYSSLVSALDSVSGTMHNLEKTSAFLPSQMPQLAVLISDFRNALKSAEDVLIALSNNPLLRGGIPERVETQSGGTSPRDIPF
ncbi:MAG: MlaD family protein [Treponema sp.]|jgi:phospholipid/cholesterol/gamma-HCH transport system substrate-binding protein|nr:MlaD family protein [Treponema sp.]